MSGKPVAIISLVVSPIALPNQPNSLQPEGDEVCENVAVTPVTEDTLAEFVRSLFRQAKEQGLVDESGKFVAGCISSHAA